MPSWDGATEHLMRHLVGTARRSGDTACWNGIPPERRTPNDPVNERSLALGSPGIALALAAARRRIHVPRADELLSLVHRWLGRELRRPPSSLGMYHGYAGLLLSYMEVSDVLGTPGTATVLAALEEHAPAIGRLIDGGPVSLDRGSGGLLAVLCSRNVFAGEERCQGLAARIVGRIAARAEGAGKGVVWGSVPDSVRPPVSFASGNFGMEYLLAALHARRPEPWLRELHAAAVTYDDAVFDHAAGNWTDFVHRRYYTDVERADALRRAARNADLRAFTRTGESLDWADGAAGGLLSRTMADKVFSDERLARDRTRALARLQRGARQVTFRSDFCLGHGWGGIALCLWLSGGGQRSDLAREIATATLSAAAEQLDRLGRTCHAGPPAFSRLNLFEGDAGLLFVFAAAAGESAESGCLLFPPFAWVPEVASLGEEIIRSARHGRLSSLPGWYLQFAEDESFADYRVFSANSTDDDLFDLAVVRPVQVRMAPTGSKAGVQMDSSDRVIVHVHRPGGLEAREVPALVARILLAAAHPTPVRKIVGQVGPSPEWESGDSHLAVRRTTLSAVRRCLAMGLLTIAASDT